MEASLYQRTGKAWTPRAGSCGILEHSLSQNNVLLPDMSCARQPGTTDYRPAGCKINNVIRAVVVTVVLFVFLGGCLLGAADTLSWPMAWVVLGIYFASKAAALVFADTDMIKDRVKLGLGRDQVDKILATLGYLGLYPGTFIVAGLDAVRFGPAIHIPYLIGVLAIVIFAIGYGLSTWAVLCNPFFSTFVRIQDDRDHTVISSGPYALIRHPGYAGVLLAHLTLPLALGSVWALLPAITGITFFVLRTLREDQELRDHLGGYREYQSRVRWRLIPGVW